MTQLQQALKEWSAAIDALVRGESILLLRKGGIREAGGKFSVPFDRVWLYPTYEHQNPDLLKEDYAKTVHPVASGWHPEMVTIQAFANITDVMQVTEATIVNSLLPFHVWNEKFVAERLKWKPKSPLYLLMLRVWKLPQAQEISYTEAYGGCRSWIDLNHAIDIDSATPVLSDEEYGKRVTQIREILINPSAIAPSSQSQTA